MLKLSRRIIRFNCIHIPTEKLKAFDGENYVIFKANYNIFLDAIVILIILDPK